MLLLEEAIFFLWIIIDNNILVQKQSFEGVL